MVCAGNRKIKRSKTWVTRETILRNVAASRGHRANDCVKVRNLNSVLTSEQWRFLKKIVT